ncbi:MAG: hypothetical protein WCL32_07790 [Planctomycetota bacterium]
MQFGQFKGSPISEVDINYLRWLWNQNVPLLLAIADELRKEKRERQERERQENLSLDQQLKKMFGALKETEQKDENDTILE